MLTLTHFLTFLIVALTLKLIFDNFRFLKLFYKIKTFIPRIPLKSLWNILFGDIKHLIEFDLSASICGIKGTRKIPFFNKWMIVVANPDDVKIILNSGNCLDKSPLQKLINLKNGLTFGNLDAWRKHNRVIRPFYNSIAVKNLHEILNQKTKILVENVERKVGKEFDICFDVTALNIEVILHTMELDVDIQRMEENERNLVAKIFFERAPELIAMRIRNFWLQSDFFFKRSTYLKKYKNDMKLSSYKYAEIILNKVKEQNFDEEKPKSFVGGLMSKKFNDEEILDEIKTIIAGGHLPTSLSLSTTLLLIAMHKNVQRKLFDEFREIFPSTKDFNVDFESLSKFFYLDQVINESMRLFPIIPFVTKQTDDEVKISDCIIPKNIGIFIPIMNIQRDEEFWGEDAHLFKPERFEKEKFEKIHPYAYLPFSKGARSCLAQKYTSSLMKVAIVHLLLNYEFDTSLKFEELTMKHILILTVAQGYKIKATKRIN